MDACFARDRKIGRSDAGETASSCYGAAVRAAILHQGPHTRYESVPGHGYVSVSCAEDGGVSAAHTNRCHRGEGMLVWSGAPPLPRPHARPRSHLLPPSTVGALLTPRGETEVMPSFTEKLAETEFYIISELNSYLIVHHPYRTIVELTPLLGLTLEDNTACWQVINDSCVTDLLMIYPPHVIALTAIFLTVVLKPSISPTSIPATPAAAGGGGGGAMGGSSSGGGSGGGGGGGGGGGVTGGGVVGGSGESSLSASGQAPQNRIARLIEWYAESKVDMEAIIDCTQEIISLYELWESFTEKACEEQICRMVKQRGIS